MDQRKKPDAAEAMERARMGIIKIASVAIAGAIISACFAYTRVEEEFVQMLIYGVAALVTVLSGMFIAGAISIKRDETHKRNFFLYDRKKKTDMPISELTFEKIRIKLLDFMSLFKRRGKLYIGDLFVEGPHIPEAFKTLFCYEILYELATDDAAIDVAAFLGLGVECADVFSKYLRENADYELSNKIREFILGYSKENGNIESFTAYIKGKKAHIENKMLQYTVENIEKFK